MDVGILFEGLDEPPEDTGVIVGTHPIEKSGTLPILQLFWDQYVVGFITPLDPEFSTPHHVDAAGGPDVQHVASPSPIDVLGPAKQSALSAARIEDDAIGGVAVHGGDRRVATPIPLDPVMGSYQVYPPRP